MGIVSILFLIFGWFNAIKGLVITSLVLSSIFTLSFGIGIGLAEYNSDTSEKVNYIINCIIQIIVLILSIVRLSKGF